MRNRLFVIATRKRNMRGEVDARGDVGEKAGAGDECEVISTNESTRARMQVTKRGDVNKANGFTLLILI